MPVQGPPTGKIGVVALALLAIGAVAALLVLWSTSRAEQQRHRAELLIRGVETFRAEKARVPRDEEISDVKRQLGLANDETCPCYERRSDNNYIVWFGLELGESATYDSSARAWDR